MSHNTNLETQKQTCNVPIPLFHILPEARGVATPPTFISYSSTVTISQHVTLILPFVISVTVSQLQKNKPKNCSLYVHVCVSAMCVYTQQCVLWMDV